MKTPFTSQQFFEVFGTYNQSVWPMQVVLYLIALTAVIFVLTKLPGQSWLVFGMVSLLWLWMGLVYHIFFFSAINKAAYIFGIFYILQSAVFIIYGCLGNRIFISFKADFYSISGIIFIIYGLVIYPVVGHFLGHIYPDSPTFGLPCPTTIFTFGLLLMINGKIPWPMIIIPFLWSIIGFSAAINFGVIEDTGLLIAGISGLIMILIRNKRLQYFQKRIGKDETK
jgi:hypothetical protein